MKRISHFSSRTNMLEQLLEVGFDYYNLPSSDGSFYWSDQIAYEFTLKEIEQIEDASLELHQMCLEFVADEVTQGDYTDYHFSDLQLSLIEQSWKNKDFHLYGRFDFGFDGKQLKLFEYNADTPTSLLEASIVQWNWLQQIEGVRNRDQFNSIHEELIERFKQLKQQAGKKHCYFAGMQSAGREDWGNIDYLCETAFLAGWNIHQLAVEDIGYDDENQQFVDLHGNNIDLIFKLYPLEWLTKTDFATYIPTAKTQFIEPMWKLLLSNKVLLAKLWKKYPNHPLLLPTYLSKHQISHSTDLWIKKPILGREGANIFYHSEHQGIEFPAKGSEHSSFYGLNGYVFQQKYAIPCFDGMYPVIGSWIVGDTACGIGIREDFTAITGNDSHFVPHYFVE